MHRPRTRRPAALSAWAWLVAALALLSAVPARARAQRVRRVAVAARPLARGTVLAAGDFVFRDTTMRGRGIGPAAPDTTPVTQGWVTRRVIAAGEVLRAPAVQPPAVVLPNQPVEIEWVDRNVRLIIRGTSTRRGALGERITVRTALGHRVDATVVGPGRVRLD